jgi:hypothetical protein
MFHIIYIYIYIKSVLKYLYCVNLLKFNFNFNVVYVLKLNFFFFYDWKIVDIEKIVLRAQNCIQYYPNKIRGYHYKNSPYYPHTITHGFMVVSNFESTDYLPTTKLSIKLRFFL